MTDLAPNAVVLHHPTRNCNCGSAEWLLVTASITVEKESALGVSSMWSCLRCGCRVAVGVGAAPRFGVSTLPGVVGQIVKPTASCICDNSRGWVLEELRIIPGPTDEEERQRTAWRCDGCGAIVICKFEPGKPAVANTTHPEVS